MSQHQGLGRRELGTEKDMRVRATRKLDIEVAEYVCHIDMTVAASEKCKHMVLLVALIKCPDKSSSSKNRFWLTFLGTQSIMTRKAWQPWKSTGNRNTLARQAACIPREQEVWQTPELHGPTSCDLLPPVRLHHHHPNSSTC